MFLDPTYRLAENPPSPLRWADYSQRVLAEWEALLASSASRAESAIQRFLERHPCMVPGAFLTAGAGKSGHYPEPPGLIAQPPLRGLHTRVPDFLWIAVDSATISPVLIEIEHPDKKWFTAANTPSAEFTQAQSQLTEWKAWMAEPANQLFFRDFFGIDDDYWRRLTFRPQYLLIYGRRSEFKGKDHLNKLRRTLERGDENYMTFDRLSPSRETREMLCLKISQPREYRVVTWPPVATLSPGLALDRVRFLELEAAVKSCEWITAERRHFLAERVPYWNSWAENPMSRRNMIRSWDRE